MSDEHRTMNDGVRLQLAFELDGVSDYDRKFRPELQPFFGQVQDIAEGGIPRVFQEAAAFDGEAELAAVVSHDGGLSQ